jgi:hypothetical protein
MWELAFELGSYEEVRNMDTDTFWDGYAAMCKFSDEINKKTGGGN